MWYALHCKTETEQVTLQSCKSNLSSKACKDIFSLTYERMRKYEGSWHLETVNLFPGYVILDSEDEAALEKELTYCRIGQQPLCRISDKEKELLQKLCGQGRHLSMSRGVIRDGIAKVTEGPLVGQEKLFQKIDRHKRLVVLKMPMRFSESGVKAGLEIMEKR